MKKPLIAALISMFFCLNAYAQGTRAPQPSCTECTAPNGGSHGDGNGNILCPDCFGKLFPQGGRLEPNQGVIVPNGHGAPAGSGAGGGGSSNTACTGCHG